jgi:hypothetical protein
MLPVVPEQGLGVDVQLVAVDDLLGHIAAHALC